MATTTPTSSADAIDLYSVGILRRWAPSGASLSPSRLAHNATSLPDLRDPSGGTVGVADCNGIAASRPPSRSSTVELVARTLGPTPAHAVLVRPGMPYVEKPGGVYDTSNALVEERNERRARRKRQERLEGALVALNLKALTKDSAAQRRKYPVLVCDEEPSLGAMKNARKLLVALQQRPAPASGSAAQEHRGRHQSGLPPRAESCPPISGPAVGSNSLVSVTTSHTDVVHVTDGSASRVRRLSPTGDAKSKPKAYVGLDALRSRAFSPAFHEELEARHKLHTALMGPWDASVVVEGTGDSPTVSPRRELLVPGQVPKPQIPDVHEMLHTIATKGVHRAQPTTALAQTVCALHVYGQATTRSVRLAEVQPVLQRVIMPRPHPRWASTLARDASGGSSSAIGNATGSGQAEHHHQHHHHVPLEAFPVALPPEGHFIEEITIEEALAEKAAKERARRGKKEQDGGRSSSNKATRAQNVAHRGKVSSAPTGTSTERVVQEELDWAGSRAAPSQHAADSSGPRGQCGEANVPAVGMSLGEYFATQAQKQTTPLSSEAAQSQPTPEPQPSPESGFAHSDEGNSSKLRRDAAARAIQRVERGRRGRIIACQRRREVEAQRKDDERLAREQEHREEERQNREAEQRRMQEQMEEEKKNVREADARRREHKRSSAAAAIQRVARGFGARAALFKDVAAARRTVAVASPAPLVAAVEPGCAATPAEVGVPSPAKSDATYGSDGFESESNAAGSPTKHDEPESKTDALDEQFPGAPRPDDIYGDDGDDFESDDDDDVLDVGNAIAQSSADQRAESDTPATGEEEAYEDDYEVETDAATYAATLAQALASRRPHSNHAEERPVVVLEPSAENDVSVAGIVPVPPVFEEHARPDAPSQGAHRRGGGGGGGRHHRSTHREAGDDELGLQSDDDDAAGFHAMQQHRPTSRASADQRPTSRASTDQAHGRFSRNHTPLSSVGAEELRPHHLQLGGSGTLDDGFGGEPQQGGVDAGPRKRRSHHHRAKDGARKRRSDDSTSDAAVARQGSDTPSSSQHFSFADFGSGGDGFVEISTGALGEEAPTSSNPATDSVRTDKKRSSKEKKEKKSGGRDKDRRSRDVSSRFDEDDDIFGPSAPTTGAKRR